MVKRLLIHRPEQEQLTKPQGLVKEGFLEEATPQLSQRSNSSDPWEKGMWTALFVSLKLPETKHSLLELVVGLLFSDKGKRLKTTSP